MAVSGIEQLPAVTPLGAGSGQRSTCQPTPSRSCKAALTKTSHPLLSPFVVCRGVVGSGVRCGAEVDCGVSCGRLRCPLRWLRWAAAGDGVTAAKPKELLHDFDFLRNARCWTGTEYGTVRQRRSSEILAGVLGANRSERFRLLVPA